LAVQHSLGVIGDGRKSGAGVRKARQGLGYRPGTSLEQGFSLQLDADRARRGLDVAA
jgi:hypothetical protein